MKFPATPVRRGLRRAIRFFSRAVAWLRAMGICLPAASIWFPRGGIGDTMPFLALDTKTPYCADLDPNDVGNTAYYAMRWVNTRGNPGPWSEITGYPII
jgi:hypothetical protein